MTVAVVDGAEPMEAAVCEHDPEADARAGCKTIARYQRCLERRHDGRIVGAGPQAGDL
jgi:hypothetical protein